MSQPEPTPASGAGSAAESHLRQLGVAGAGTIACGVAAAAAARGIEVVMWARSAQSGERAMGAVARLCEKAGNADASGRIEVTSTLDALDQERLVVEAVVEREQVKRELLQSLGAILPPEAVIATTTSSLSVSELAGSSGRPGRFFGLHVFNPVDRMELVELCFPDEADAATRQAARGLCRAIGKTAVEVPDEPGFVVNRLLFPYLFDAVRLLERTGMDPEAIDACMKLGASHPMGPLELLDLVGIDVAEAIGEALHADTGDAAHYPPGRIKQLVREGRLGRKSGAGFYRYG